MPDDYPRTELPSAGLPTDAATLAAYIQAALGVRKVTKLLERLWRFSAHIRQPRKDIGSCNSTPLFDRWDTNPTTSYLEPADPRYASIEECRRIYMRLLASVLEAQDIKSLQKAAIDLASKELGRPLQPATLTCLLTGQPITAQDIALSFQYSTSQVGTYELPVCYSVELNSGGLHRHQNVGWMKPIHVIYALRDALRTHLTQSGLPKSAVGTALDKIQVKAYCTDKQTMPPHYSNRDIRWATWPQSLQYASHFDCAMIDLELMAQLYEFVDAPPLDADLAAQIQATRGKPILPDTRRCFVTGRLLSFRNYIQNALEPEGGKSNYHVGHILPLTAGGKHRSNNIAWQSDDGNRIQGNDRLVVCQS